MSENRKGEVVKVTADQLDDNGQRMSSLTVEWYGMTNQEGNAMTMGIVQALLNSTAEWSNIKTQGGKLKG